MIILFFIESCENPLQAYFSVVADTSCVFLTTTNGHQKSIAAKNNKNIPLITDDCLLLM